MQDKLLGPGVAAGPPVTTPGNFSGSCWECKFCNGFFL